MHFAGNRIGCSSGLTPADYEKGFYQELKYSRYNSYGKPGQVESKGITTVYLWSYDGAYPVAEIRNADYTDVQSALSPDFIDALSKKSIPSDNDIKVLNDLRNKLPSTLITTYTYAPLIGVTSITDERGFTIYYDYDNSGRLSESYIMTGAVKSVLEKYSYNYRH